ncbi:hypothetical protein ACQ5SO_12580 [Rhodovulum sp. DZ06]|uniref:hypothetical protein n=1 Tax=Rhodovulum sp. DZ06 TaxID=3425126 RepID=UPI003D331A92
MSPISALCFALLAAAPLATAIASAPEPRAGEAMVVVAPPWRDAAALAASAGGLVLRQGRIPAVAMSYAPDPDHADALRRAGAIAVLPADLALILCEPSP